MMALYCASSDDMCPLFGVNEMDEFGTAGGVSGGGGGGGGTFRTD